MQTFIVSYDQAETARILDTKRLGKQRVEAIQIASCLLEHATRWSLHPAVKMWKGYETYLVKVYLRAMITEWGRRGYSNEKCNDHFYRLSLLIKDDIVQPKWLNDDFILAHKSNLLRKNYEYYSKFFPNVPVDLQYIWPES